MITRRKICVYTVVTNDYDELHPPLHMVTGADYIIVTDNPANKLRGYKQVILDRSDDPVKQQRYIKAYPYDILPGYDVYIYYDASYAIRRNLGGLLQLFKGGFMVKRHPSRDCIYKEAEAVIALSKGARDVVDAQMHYAKNIMEIPPGYGLQETGILVRDASDQTKALCRWWREAIEHYSHRDQLALPMAIKATGIQPVYINREMMNSHFKQHKHRQVVQPQVAKEPERPHIAYIQPFASDLNIGKEFNYHIETVRPGDYICLLDHDCMFLHPKTKQQIEDIVLKNGDKYDLLGCLTNRIGSPHQRYQEVMSDNTDVLHHMEIAAKLHRENYGEVIETKQGIAGFLMLFRKSVWDAIKFKENSKHFDTVFCKDIRKKGGRLGIMTGVYVYHQYRHWAKGNPQSEVSHLEMTRK